MIRIFVTGGTFDKDYNELTDDRRLPPGVYIAMHGRCFNWDGVRKNRTTGTFEDI